MTAGMKGLASKLLPNVQVKGRVTEVRQKKKSKNVYCPAFIFHTDLQFCKWQVSQPACVFMFPSSTSKPGSRATDNIPVSSPPAGPEAKQQMIQHEFEWINAVVITNFRVKSAIDSFLKFSLWRTHACITRPSASGNEPDVQSLQWRVQGQAALVAHACHPGWLPTHCFSRHVTKTAFLLKNFKAQKLISDPFKRKPAIQASVFGNSMFWRYLRKLSNFVNSSYNALS